SRLSFINPRIFFHEVVTPTYPLFDNFPPYSLALSTKMVEVARHAPLDVLHVHYAIPNAVSAVMARQILSPQALPVVTTLHGTDVTLVGNDPNYLETTRWGMGGARSPSRSAAPGWSRSECARTSRWCPTSSIRPATRRPRPARGPAAGPSRGSASWSTSPTSGRSSGCSTSSASSSGSRR